MEGNVSEQWLNIETGALTLSHLSEGGTYRGEKRKSSSGRRSVNISRTPTQLPHRNCHLLRLLVSVHLPRKFALFMQSLLWVCGCRETFTLLETPVSLHSVSFGNASDDIAASVSWTGPPSTVSSVLPENWWDSLVAAGVGWDVLRRAKRKL